MSLIRQIPWRRSNTCIHHWSRIQKLRGIRFCPLLILGKTIFPRFMINREVNTFSSQFLLRSIIEDTQHRCQEEMETARDIQDSHRKKLLVKDRGISKVSFRCRTKDISTSRDGRITMSYFNKMPSSNPLISMKVTCTRDMNTIVKQLPLALIQVIGRWIKG